MIEIKSHTLLRIGLKWRTNNWSIDFFLFIHTSIWQQHLRIPTHWNLPYKRAIRAFDFGSVCPGFKSQWNYNSDIDSLHSITFSIAILLKERNIQIECDFHHCADSIYISFGITEQMLIPWVSNSAKAGARGCWGGGCVYRLANYLAETK